MKTLKKKKQWPRPTTQSVNQTNNSKKKKKHPREGGGGIVDDIITYIVLSRVKWHSWWTTMVQFVVKVDHRTQRLFH